MIARIIDLFVMQRIPIENTTRGVDPRTNSPEQLRGLFACDKL